MGEGKLSGLYLNCFQPHMKKEYKEFRKSSLLDAMIENENPFSELVLGEISKNQGSSWLLLDCLEKYCQIVHSHTKDVPSELHAWALYSITMDRLENNFSDQEFRAIETKYRLCRNSYSFPVLCELHNYLKRHVFMKDV